MRDIAGLRHARRQYVYPIGELSLHMGLVLQCSLCFRKLGERACVVIFQRVNGTLCSVHQRLRV